MEWFGEMWRRLLFLFRRRQFESDLEEEMRFHAERKADVHCDAGMPPEDARHLARRQFGNATLLAERSREMWGWVSLERLGQDLKYGFRTLRMNPGFTGIAVVTLALGIGANTAMFSVLYGVCLAPLPYAEPDRLVDVSMKQLTGRQFEAGTSLPNLREWQNATHAFEGLAPHRHEFFVNLTGYGEADEVHAWRLSSPLLPLLGVAPLIGRSFLPEEDLAGGPRRALLSYGLWQSRFGGRSDALGRSVYVDGAAYTIIGVMPPHFAFPPLIGRGNPVIWLSLNLSAGTANSRETHSLEVAGRLKRGVTVGQAQIEMTTVAQRLAKAYPKENSEWAGAKVALLGDRFIEEFRSVLWMLTGAAGLVLLIACANVAGLLLSRSAAREREFAIRRALGVSRTRLIRQLLTESCILAAIGCGAGILLAYWSLPLLKPLLEAKPRVDEIAIRPAVLAFAVVLSGFTAVAFGLAPAWHSATSLRVASARPRLRRAFVTSEVGLALLLLSSAGLLIESFWRATHVDLGFRPEHAVTMRVTLPKQRYDTGRKVEAFREEWLRRVAVLPGVEFAGTNSAPPMSILAANTGIGIEGASTNEEVSAGFNNVSAGYLPAMGIPLLRGRNFAQTDRPGAPRVAIISQSLARRMFGVREPLGRQVRLDRFESPESFIVVGIAGDVRDRPEQEPKPAVYVFSSQLPESAQGDGPGRVIVMTIRTASEPIPIASAARAAAAEIDKDQPVSDVMTMSRLLGRQLASRRLNTLLVGLFAALALALAAVGVFGLVAYSVARRTHEIGIRVALGARRSSILSMIARETLALGAVGVAAGVVGSLAATRLLASMLYKVKPADPYVISGAAAFLTVAILGASLLAARKAVDVDPVIALRHD